MMMATQIDTINTAIIVGMFVVIVGAFLLSVVWRLYWARSNDPDPQERYDI